MAASSGQDMPVFKSQQGNPLDLVPAAPELPAGHPSTAFSVKAFQEEAAALYGELYELVHSLLVRQPDGQEPDIGVDQLRYESEYDRQQRALDEAKRNMHQQQQGSDAEAKEEAQADDLPASQRQRRGRKRGAAARPRQRRSRAKYSDNRPGRNYERPQDQLTPQQTEAIVERVRCQYAQDLARAGEVLQSVEAAEHATPASGRDGKHRPSSALPANLGPDDSVSADDVILRVEIHKPDTVPSRARVEQEFAVLGSQPLTVLRDAMRCNNDANMRAIGASRPSSFMYLEGVFYNDLRQPDATDLSEPIRNFLVSRGQTYTMPEYTGCEGRVVSEAQAPQHRSEKGERQAAWECADMACTSFAQLDLRIGSGTEYSLCHQGCCEHMLVVTDVRRLSASDPPWKAAYPLLLHQAQTSIKTCCICGKHAVTQITYNDKSAPDCPAFWCPSCYTMLHYSKDGLCIDADHKVFPYHAG